MRRYLVKVFVMAECESDLIERLGDYKENPIDTFLEHSIREFRTDCIEEVKK